ncbi:MAG: ATP-binding protein, partial [Planctomycetota bacterium JB042]
VVERLLDAAREAAVAAGRTARVLVRVTLQDDRVVVLVRDPLPSPPSEDDWFDPAYSPAGRRGLGLALALARAVAERRDGEARAAPSGKQGLAVRISWPVAAATGEAAPADRDAAPDPRAKRAATAAKAAEPAEDRAAIRARIRAVIRDAV